MQEILMTPDVCMRFLVWSYYYHGVMPEKNVSYRECGKFDEEDSKRLDELKEMLFKCFEEQSVVNACRQFQLAKVRQEPCPFSQTELDQMFAKEKEIVTIRKAKQEDISEMLKVFAVARRFMAETGNKNQWAEDYPSVEMLTNDINSGDCYVCMQKGEIVATFVLRGGEDPTYEVIYGGEWKNNNPYATIHRIASNQKVKGIFKIAMEFALKTYETIRIDTHRDNSVMQKIIEREGFEYCGIIHCWNGDERLAYQYN